MKKTLKTLCIIFVFALLISIFTVVSCAADGLLGATSAKRYVVDDANLLTATDRINLEKKLSEMSEELKFDIVAHTTNTLNGKDIEAYSDDFFDYNGYGYGNNGDIKKGDGAVLVIDMSTRTMHISTKGLGIKAFSDYDIEYTFDQIQSSVKSGNYYNAFSKFADICEVEVKDATSFPIMAVVIGVIAGFILSLIPLKKMKDELKSVRMQRSAANYAVKDSFNVTLQNDLFMYSNTTKIRIESDSSRGGGSSHFSSSGSSHGGGSRSF